jgi:hypothetical protein
MEIYNNCNSRLPYCISRVDYTCNKNFHLPSQKETKQKKNGTERCGNAGNTYLKWERDFGTE